MYGCLLCAHQRFLPFFSSVAPGETHSILCDHAGVSLPIYLISFTSVRLSKTYVATLLKTKKLTFHINVLLLEEEKTRPGP